MIEHEDVRSWNVGLCSSFESVGKQFRFYYQGLDLSCFEGMGELVGRVRGIDASEDPSER
jgi:hypothetical protein